MAENAPASQEEGTTTESAEKKSSKKMIFMLAIIPIAATLAFLLVVKVVNPRFAPPANDAPVAQEEETEGAIWELGTKLANPLGTRGARVVKVSVSIEIASEDLLEGVEKKRKRLEDRFLTVLTAKTLSDVSSPEGKIELKEELKEAFTSDLGLKEGDIRRVYFGDFVIQ